MVRNDPLDWKQHGSSFFKIVTDKIKTYSEARSACAEEGATLGTVKDKETHDFIISLKNTLEENARIWIGLNDIYREGSFVWEDGSPIGGFNKWGSAQPNDKNNQDCVQVTAQNLWGDADCDDGKGYLCEKRVYEWSQVSVIGSSGTPMAPMYDAARTLDGDPETYWYPARLEQHFNHWYIVYDIGESHELSRIGLNNYGDTVHDVKEFTLQVSDSCDQPDWKDVLTVTDVAAGSNATQEFTGFMETSRYWRVLITETHTGWPPFLVGIEFPEVPTVTSYQSCQTIDTESGGEVRNLMYPKPSSYSCEALVTIGSQQTMELTFGSPFSMDYHPDCRFDYVELFDYVAEQWVSMGRFCGRSRPSEVIRSHGNAVKVIFHADGSVPSLFSLAWQPIYATLNRTDVNGCSVLYLTACDSALGMETGDIPDTSISASSEYNSGHCRIVQGRLNRASHYAWCAGQSNQGQWLQVDLGSATVSGVVTQGRRGANQYVKKYKLSFSGDGDSWTTYKDTDGSDKVFNGNKNDRDAVTQTLHSPVTTRYIRFVPQTWHGHISLRVEILGCYVCPRLTAPTNGNMTTNSYQDVVDFTCRTGYRLQGISTVTCQANGQWTSSEATCTVCQAPLGMESRAIPNSAITASSEYEHNDGHHPYYGRLNREDGLQAWCAAVARHVAGEWLQVDLGGAAIVYGVITQGRNTIYNQCVTSYKLQFSWDETSWTTYKDSDGSDKILQANTDGETAVTQLLRPQVTTRYIRFVVQTWNNHICMRVEVLGCMDADCLEPLGMEAGYIADTSITAASVAHGGLEPYNGRLNGVRGHGAWAGTQVIGEWLQVDLGGVVKVYGVITQGRMNADQWVTQYKLQFSLNETSWTTYKDSDGSDKVFAGNTDRTTAVTHTLRPPVSAWYIRFVAQSWSGYVAMRVEVLGCMDTGCLEPLGLESGRIEDSSITASSSWSNTHHSYYARLNKIKGTGSWVGGVNIPGQWLQVDLGGVAKVQGVITQGRANTGQWVKSYNLQFSWDETSWTTYKDSDGSDKVFTGNTDTTTEVTHVLRPPVSTRYIRFVVQTWNRHQSMRVEVLGCMDTGCRSTLGMESRHVLDDRITASSEHGGETCSKSLGRLNQAGSAAWCAGNTTAGEWIQVDLGFSMVSGVITQGRDAQLIASVQQYVTSYKLLFSKDGDSWTTYRDMDGSDKIFTGNSDATTPVVHALHPPVTTRYIRVVALTWHNWISMRLEVLGCYGVGISKEV
ncbi:uncharacterized protein LOC144926863 [Branchiostoma floridae x Branchiostoma belcheri]